jgi:addiction module RelE/StbE family toxin
MQVRFSKNFTKCYDRANLKIRKAFDKRLKIFLQNPFYSTLNNHSLIGKYSSYRSINITGDWRAIYSEYVDVNEDKQVIFELIGTHSQLYK